jgi:uncharacterized protein (DUF433 family)
MQEVRFEDYFEILDPDEIRLKGHRIYLEDVLELYKEGMTADQLSVRFPTLALEHIHAAIAYYNQHRAEVENYLALAKAYAEEQTRIAEAHPSPPIQRLRAVLDERWPNTAQVGHE